MSASNTMNRHQSSTHSSHKFIGPYYQLIMMGLIHFFIMYAVMFTMVDKASSIFINLNNFYMTGMMLAPMLLLMPLTMAAMYPNKKMNLWIYLGSTAVFGILFSFMRYQTFIDDKEFLRSMIPHHSGAVLMCGKAKLTDPEIKELCSQIIDGQRAEIEQMKKILNRL